jgi:hypothetical protein
MADAFPELVARLARVPVDVQARVHEEHAEHRDGLERAARGDLRL